MEIRTSKGHTYNVDWIGGPTGIKQEIFCEFEDARPLHEIAMELEDAEITAIERGGVETTYHGYTELARISREAETDIVQIAMRRPLKKEAE